MATYKYQDLEQELKIGTVILVTAEALIGTRAATLARIYPNYIVLDPYKNENLEKILNVEGLVFTSIIPIDTIKIIVNLTEAINQLVEYDSRIK